MKLSRALAEFIVATRLSKSPATAHAYESDLSRLVAISGQDSVQSLTPVLIQSYFGTLSTLGLARSSLHRKAASLRTFLRWGQRQRLWSGDLLLEVPDIKSPESLPRPFTPEEQQAIWKLDLSPRDRAMRALLFFTGLRASSICGISVSDITVEPPKIRTVGKGSKPFIVDMHPLLVTVIAEYLVTLQGVKPQTPLLLLKDGQRMTRAGLERITLKWGRQAGVPHCTPHRFRHTFATEQLRSGKVSPFTLQRTMNHASIQSTMLYTKVHDEQIQAAILSLPDSWKEKGA